MKTLGCINACCISSIFDRQNNCIGTCLDTPNNKAYVFSTNKKAFKISGLNGYTVYEDVKNHVFGLNADYHKQNVKYF